MNNSEILLQGAAQFGVELREDQLQAFLTYMSTLKEWNEKINLTAIEDDRDIIIKHFIDSLSIMPHIKPGSAMIDVGTGAGFPGIPVKLTCGNVKVTLLDSLEKRIKFLDNTIRLLGLTGISTVHSRAEDYGMTAENREAFDYAAARAVASLPVLLEYCLPFVRIGGAFIAMKGSSTDEVAASKRALQILGGEVEKVHEFTLPFTDVGRSIIIIRKLRQTPTKYPRKAGKPSKEPLL